MKNSVLFLFILLIPCMTSAQRDTARVSTYRKDSLSSHARLLNLSEFKYYQIKYSEKHHIRGKYNCDTIKFAELGFIVLETGQLDTASVIVLNNKRGWVSEAFKQDSVRFMKEAPSHWLPATYKGKPYASKCKMQIPCSFFK